MEARGGSNWKWGSHYDSTSQSHDDAASARATESHHEVSAPPVHERTRTAPEAHVDDVAMRLSRAGVRSIEEPSAVERRLWQIDADARRRERASRDARDAPGARRSFGALDARYADGGSGGGLATRDAVALATLVIAVIILVAAAAIIVQLALLGQARAAPSAGSDVPNASPVDEGAQSGAAVVVETLGDGAYGASMDPYDPTAPIVGRIDGAAAAFDPLHDARSATPSWAYASQPATPEPTGITPQERASLAQLTGV